MGEAKRNKVARENGRCLCGSGKPAGACCYNGRSWFRRPAVLGLRALPSISAVDKCYMRELGSCQGPISGEHLFTHSIMLLLKGTGDFSISGVPWLPAGETKILSTKKLVAKCLCQKHNSAISPLDDAALQFFSVLKSGLDRAAKADFIVSGHDIERWLLKTIKALASSNNLARGGEQLPGSFAKDIPVLDLLDDPQAWPEGAGLYCPMITGETAENQNRFQLQPYTKRNNEIVGLAANILGLTFVLMLQPPDFAEVPQLKTARYRPGQISISYPSSRSRIQISWDDDRRHEPLSLMFLREANP